ncbi:MAG: hypothetical protein ABMA14_03220 [Hyphomonadaceae bacterium]
MPHSVAMFDPDTFKSEPARTRWRFHTTDRLGQFDIAVPSDDDLNPHAAALTHLEAALTRIDALYDAALPVAEHGWVARYNGPLRDRSAWSLVRIFADETGSLVLTLHEGDFDTYCVWDVAFTNGHPTRALQRPYGG